MLLRIRSSGGGCIYAMATSDPSDAFSPGRAHRRTRALKALRSGGRAPSKSRWLLPPALGAVVVGTVAVGPRLAGADAPPKLSPIGVSELISNVAHAKAQPLQGTVTTSADLGLGALSSLSSGVPALSALVSGKTTERIWLGTQGRARIEILAAGSEQDLVVTPGVAWWWDSATQAAAQVSLPSGPTKAGGPGDRGRGSSGDATTPSGALTPQGIAEKMLAMARSSTRSYVAGTTYVAGKPAYELVVAPKASGSLVADVVIDVQAGTWMPLSVQILARNQSTPAFQVGYTSLSYVPPDGSVFSFRPPPGAKVTRLAVPSRAYHAPMGRGHHGSELNPGAMKPPGSFQTLGSGWESILVTPPLKVSSARLKALLATAPRVSGPWGSGKVVATTLVNALVLPSGRVLVGSVPLATLEAAAGQVH